jgi:hypothetical protein
MVSVKIGAACKREEADNPRNRLPLVSTFSHLLTGGASEAREYIPRQGFWQYSFCNYRENKFPASLKIHKIGPIGPIGPTKTSFPKLSLISVKMDLTS